MAKEYSPNSGQGQVVAPYFGGVSSCSEGHFPAAYRSETSNDNDPRYLAENADLSCANDNQNDPIASILGIGDSQSTLQPPRRRVPRSTSIKGADDRAILKAAEHSRIIGRELNVLVTLNLPAIRRADPADRPAMWKAERRRVIQWFADNDNQLTFIWARESLDRDGAGEHLHLGLHVPPHLRRPLMDLLNKRHGGFPAVDWKDGDTRWRPTARGNRKSLQGYVAKQTNFLRAAIAGRRWEKGGAILGKRVGWSNDLTPRAVSAFRRANGMLDAA